MMNKDGYVECANANVLSIDRYFELLKDAKVKGYLFAQQNYLDQQYKNQ